MGCPTPKITKNGEGCELMLRPQLAAEIISEVPGIVSVTYNIATKPPSTIEAV
jgi:tRNA-dihydrouridine synthase